MEELKTYLEKSFIKGSKSFKDYELAKKWLQNSNLDYDTGIKEIVNYLKV